ncbi:hypothetical protein D3C78_1575190 [compost metagenome]
MMAVVFTVMLELVIARRAVGTLVNVDRLGDWPHDDPFPFSVPFRPGQDHAGGCTDGTADDGPVAAADRMADGGTGCATDGATDNMVKITGMSGGGTSCQHEGQTGHDE